MKLSAILFAIMLLTSCQGRMERARELNAQAVDRFMLMDYAQANDIYRQLLDLNPDMSMQLTANIGLMRICQRTSDNVAFYEYRNRILLLLRTMHDEKNMLSGQDIAVLESLERQFRMESAYYYHELGQRVQANAEIEQVAGDMELENDTGQWLMYLYLRGLGIGQDSQLNAGTKLARQMSLEQCIDKAATCGDSRMQAMAQCALSALLLENGTDADRACKLALDALDTAGVHDELHEELTACCQTAACLAATARYGKALEYLDHAMELAGMATAPDGGNPALPGSIAGIHELMSVSWAGLDSTALANFHRDAYLELQKYIRFDGRYKARHDLLVKTNERLSLYILCIALSIVLLALVHVLLLRRLKRHNLHYASVMGECMQLCRSILQPVPQGQLDGRMRTVVAPWICRLTGALNVAITDSGQLDIDWGTRRPDSIGKAVVQTVTPFIEQAYSSDSLLLWQMESLEQATRNHYLYEMHLKQNKRANLERRACCQAVTQCLPWIDRMKDSIERLQGMNPASQEYAAGMDYVRQMASMIMRYNDVLSRWIAIRKGEVRLNVSSFPIQELFDIVASGSQAFKSKGIDFTVNPSTAQVKADRVLTLFMINTLADNARKFTPAGGSVVIEAIEQPDYVEICVADTGCGLTGADVEHINCDRILDAGTVGGTADGHGSGFGLMNCKGIIDKYRKSHEMFRVCSFHVESRVGQGSRFSFRLAKAVSRIMPVLLVLLLTAVPMRAQNADSLLNMAYLHAQRAYELNVLNESDSALIEAGLAIDMLNLDYIANGGNGRMLSIVDSLQPAELEWIDSGFESDYETVLWMRNEVAVSALAIKDWTLYHYNNNAYLNLFKRYFSNTLLEQECAVLQHSASNRSIALILFVLVLASAMLVLFVVYARHWIRYRSDLKQMVRIVGRIRKALATASDGSLDAQSALQNMCDSILPDMDSLLGLSGVGVVLHDVDRTLSAHSGTDGGAECLELPLAGNLHNNEPMGTLQLSLKGHAPSDMDIVQMICDYMGTALSSMLLRFESGYNDLNRINQESAHMKLDDERLHVNSMVIDNCLSALKHETVWYPARIMQLTQSGNVADMLETVTYYRSIFGILSQQAAGQISTLVLSPAVLDCRSLADTLCATIQSMHSAFKVEVSMPPLSIKADAVLTAYLMETLVQRSIELGCTGPVQLSAIAEGGFVRFEFLCPGLQANPDTLFSPLDNADSMAYVLCSRIIREHDECFSHIGCRINAEIRQGGLLLWFTLPKA